MQVDFDSHEDSIAQAYILVEALSEWLKEQPAPASPCPGKVRFSYRADHTLDNVRIVMDEDV